MKRIFILISISLLSCNDFLEIDPDSSNLNADLVFENDNTAIVALEALYHELEFNGFGSGDGTSLSYLGNTFTDDAKEYSQTTDKHDFYTNTVHARNSTNYDIWSSIYAQMYRVSALLEGISDNENLSQEIKNRIEGEVKFLRAFYYYYLIYLYGDVPLVMSTDYTENKSLASTSIEEIRKQIKKDLNEALELLPADYHFADGQRIRPNKYAAYLMLARLALWEKDYDKAVITADEILNSGNYSLLPLDEIFKANSLETIWSLLPGNPNTGANDGYIYILESNPETPYTSATSSLTDDLLSVWEPGDLRYSNWINVYTEGTQSYYYPFKYKIKNGGDTEEYSVVMRLAEVYLIRAEAYAMQGKVSETLANLNVLRNRAGLPDWTTTDISDIKQTVLEERRRELFSEWGHRWLDLKRFGKLDMLLGRKKSTWDSHAQLLPIPEQELLRNPFLTQNPGY